VIVEFGWYLFPVAVLTCCSRERIYAKRILDERWIVDNPATLTSVVQEMFSERKPDRG
jgi:hypothetical protein